MRRNRLDILASLIYHFTLALRMVFIGYPAWAWWTLFSLTVKPYAWLYKISTELLYWAWDEEIPKTKDQL